MRFKDTLLFYIFSHVRTVVIDWIGIFIIIPFIVLIDFIAEYYKLKKIRDGNDS